MSIKKITPIILSGGIGSRLWPLSTKNLPKQFLKLPFGSKNNLFQQTIEGFKNKKYFSPPLVVCGNEHKFLMLESLKKLSDVSGIIVEQIQRNTATSILLGVLFSLKKFNSDFSLVAPSDHYIKNRDYSKLIPKKNELTNSHFIYGVSPNEPISDYGYIRVDNPNVKISKVRGFFEKPNEKKAKEFLKKKYFWNSGIFLLNNKKLIEDYMNYQPKIFSICKKILNNLDKDLDFIKTSERLLKRLPVISFDEAILEKTKNLSMMKLDLLWRDLGTWGSLIKLSSKKNHQLDEGSFIYNNSKNTNVISDRKNTIINDVEDAIIISNKESIFVSSKKNSHKIKDILTDKKFKNVSDFQSVFYKPWGHYEVFSQSKNYLLKKITIKPKHRLSLQKHNFRSEHWVVVQGSAKIIRGNEKKILKKNQSTFIPIGVTHCIENVGKNNLEIIEVQMGSVISESDIVRLDDPYSR